MNRMPVHKKAGPKRNPGPAFHIILRDPGGSPFHVFGLLSRTIEPLYVSSCPMHPVRTPQYLVMDGSVFGHGRFHIVPVFRRGLVPVLLECPVEIRHIGESALVSYGGYVHRGLCQHP